MLRTHFDKRIPITCLMTSSLQAELSLWVHFPLHGWNKISSTSPSTNLMWIWVCISPRPSMEIQTFYLASYLSYIQTFYLAFFDAFYLTFGARGWGPAVPTKIWNPRSKRNAAVIKSRDLHLASGEKKGKIPLMSSSSSSFVSIDVCCLSLSQKRYLVVQRFGILFLIQAWGTAIC